MLNLLGLGDLQALASADAETGDVCEESSATAGG